MLPKNLGGSQTFAAIIIWKHPKRWLIWYAGKLNWSLNKKLFLCHSWHSWDRWLADMADIADIPDMPELFPNWFVWQRSTQLKYQRLKRYLIFSDASKTGVNQETEISLLNLWNLYFFKIWNKLVRKCFPVGTGGETGLNIYTKLHSPFLGQ